MQAKRQLTKQTFAVQAEDENMWEGTVFHIIALSVHVSALTWSSTMFDKTANLQCQQSWRSKEAVAFRKLSSQIALSAE